MSFSKTLSFKFFYQIQDYVPICILCSFNSQDSILQYFFNIIFIKHFFFLKTCPFSFLLKRPFCQRAAWLYLLQGLVQKIL